MAPLVPVPSSSINKPADELGPAPSELQVFGPRIIQHGGGEAPAGLFRMALGDYSCPIHQISVNKDGRVVVLDYLGRPTPTPVYGYWSKFYATAFSQAANSQGNVKPGGRIPDSSRFTAGTGNDNIFLIERRETGESWHVWMARQPVYNALTLTNLVAGILAANPRHVAGAADYMRNIYVPSFTTPLKDWQRGSGQIKRAMITTAEEIETGKIRHALELTIANSWYSESAAPQATAGVDYLYPALRCEWDAAHSLPTRNGRAMDGDKTKLVPEGLRFRFKLTASERNAYLNQIVGTSATPFRFFCKVVLDAICDYGFVVAETGNYGMLSEFDGIMGPARNVYRDKFGIVLSNPRPQEEIFKNLMVTWASRVEVVNPAL